MKDQLSQNSKGILKGEILNYRNNFKYIPQNMTPFIFYQEVTWIDRCSAVDCHSDCSSSTIAVDNN